MLDSVLPLTENSFTGANVLIPGVEMGVLEVPLHKMNIKSNSINGIFFIIRPDLSMPCGIHSKWQISLPFFAGDLSLLCGIALTGYSGVFY